MFLYYKSDITKLLNDMLYFWSSRNFTSAHVLFKHLNLAQKYFITGAISLIIAFCLRPVFKDNIHYIFDCWIPESLTLQAIILICQYYFISILLYVGASYDSMYVSYSLHIIIQLRLLKRKLKNLAGDGDITTVYKCVNHHQLLLS